MQDLQSLIQQKIGQREQEVAMQQQQLNALQGQPKKMDLTPLMMAADMFAKKGDPSMMGMYQQMKPKDNTMKIQALKQQLMQQKQGLTGDQIKLLSTMNKKEADAKKTALNLTPGEEKKDKSFAVKAADWDAGGGFASFAGNLDRLKNASISLGEKGDLSNTIMPKAIRDVFNPESAKLQEDVEFVAQQSLKQILGGQFGEKEGQRLIERTYNPRLPDSVNQRKLDGLIRQLEIQGQAKERAIKYFNKNGTLKGFEGTSMTSLEDFEKKAKKEIMGQIDTPNRNIQALDWAKANSDDPRSAKILEKLERGE